MTDLEAFARDLLAHGDAIQKEWAASRLTRPFEGDTTDPAASDRHAAILAAIRECPDRGSVLPVSRQPGCGCLELTECRTGHGKRPGEVTTRECYECRS